MFDWGNCCVDWRGKNTRSPVSADTVNTDLKLSHAGNTGAHGRAAWTLCCEGAGILGRVLTPTRFVCQRPTVSRMVLKSEYRAHSREITFCLHWIVMSAAFASPGVVRYCGHTRGRAWDRKGQLNWRTSTTPRSYEGIWNKDSAANGYEVREGSWAESMSPL